MPIISIEQAGKYDGQEVTIRGWLYNIRESGKLVFPIFRDGTGIIQGVCALVPTGSGARMSTRAGRLTLKRRRDKGRKRLST